MKKLIAIVCVAAILLAFAACSSKEDELLGTWRSPGGGFTLTFYSDGTYKYTNLGNFSTKGTWKISNGKLGLDGAEGIEYRVEDNKLILTANGQSETWRRY